MGDLEVLVFLEPEHLGKTYENEGDKDTGDLCWIAWWKDWTSTCLVQMTNWEVRRAIRVPISSSSTSATSVSGRDISGKQTAASFLYNDPNADSNSVIQSHLLISPWQGTPMHCPKEKWVRYCPKPAPSLWRQHQASGPWAFHGRPLLNLAPRGNFSKN